MVKVEICIGSSCFVKGSNQIVGIMNEIIAENGWQNEIDLKGSFCMQACQDKKGLGIRIDGERIDGINLQNAKMILVERLSEIIE